MEQKNDDEPVTRPRKLSLLGRDYHLPQSRLMRTIVGFLLIVGGLLGFLPVLGFWMIPLGILVLSHDFSFVRRFRRKTEVRLSRWWAARQQRSK